MNTVEGVDTCSSCKGKGTILVPVPDRQYSVRRACTECRWTGLVQIENGEPAVIPSSCECSENGTCLYPPCVKAYKAEYLRHAPITRPLKELWWLAS
jgi:hypothetical protein